MTAPSYGSTDEVRFSRPGEIPTKDGQQVSRDGSLLVTDEVFNAASHFVAFMFSLLGGAALVVEASVQEAPLKIIGFAIYAATLSVMFGASALHHGLGGSRALERSLRIADYCATYFLPKWISLTIFMSMGWMGLFLALLIRRSVGIGGILLLAAGGVAYTGGGYVYQAEDDRMVLIAGRLGHHEIWHCAVIAGAVLHYAFMWFFVLPWKG